MLIVIFATFWNRTKPVLVPHRVSRFRGEPATGITGCTVSKLGTFPFMAVSFISGPFWFGGKEGEERESGAWVTVTDTETKKCKSWPARSSFLQRTQMENIEERNGCHIHGQAWQGTGRWQRGGRGYRLGSSTLRQRPLLPPPAQVDKSSEGEWERAATSAKRDFQGCQSVLRKSS